MAERVIPTLKKPVVRYRGKTSSEEYNQMTQDLYFDLTNLFTASNDNAERAEQVIRQLNIENMYLKTKVDELLARLGNIEDMLKQIQQGSNKYTQVKFVDSFEEDPDAETTKRAFIDRQHKIATLPINGAGISKTHIWNSFKDEAFIPDELKITLNRPISTYANATETDPRNAFDGKETTYWERIIRYPEDDPTDMVEVEMIVELPENIVNNHNINTIIVHPYPSQGIDILGIEYPKTAVSDPAHATWEMISCWPRDIHGEPLVIENAGPMKFCFEDRQAKMIRIRLRQRKPYFENNEKVFVLGLKTFDILYNNYTTETASLMVPFELTSPLSSMFAITDIEPIFGNEASISRNTNPCSYEIYLEDAYGNLEYLDNSPPITNINSSKIWIKVQLKADEYKELTPALAGLKITYEAII